MRAGVRKARGWAAGARPAGRWAACGALVLALAAAAARGAAPAQTPTAGAGEARVTVEKAAVALGDPVGFHAWVTVPEGVVARWLPADSSETFEYSGMRAGRRSGGGRDTLTLDATLRVWLPGHHRLPGPRVLLASAAGHRTVRLPATEVTGTSALRGNAPQELRPWRAPLAPPWWERLPWRWVAAGILALVGLWLLWRALRRRPEAAAAAAPPPDPAEAALEALAALRARRLPEAGRIAEHAYELGQILRRYLEATAGTPRPGDTTPELVGHLEDARFDAADVGRLRDLLGGWDQIKFARRAAAADEALGSEHAVEELLRRGQTRKAAA